MPSQPVSPPVSSVALRTSATRRPVVARKLPARKRLVARLWVTAEKQVDEIEARLSMLGDDPQALEREAKTLAIIARTVRDLVAIDAETQVNNKAAPQRDDAPARSIDDFRNELALKLDQLRAERGGREAP